MGFYGAPAPGAQCGAGLLRKKAEASAFLAFSGLLLNFRKFISFYKKQQGRKAVSAAPASLL
jgi:hypothetical protein